MKSHRYGVQVLALLATFFWAQTTAMADRAAPPYFADLLHNAKAVYRGRIVLQRGKLATPQLAVTSTLKGAPLRQLPLPLMFEPTYWSEQQAAALSAKGFGSSTIPVPLGADLIVIVDGTVPLAVLAPTMREFAYVAPVLALLSNDASSGTAFVTTKIGRQEGNEFYWLLRNVLNIEVIPTALRAHLATTMYRNLQRDFWSGYEDFDRALVHSTALPELLVGLARLRLRDDQPSIGVTLLAKFRDPRVVPSLLQTLDEQRVRNDRNGLAANLDALAAADPTTHACARMQINDDDFAFASAQAIGPIEADDPAAVVTPVATSHSGRVLAPAERQRCEARLLSLRPALTLDETTAVMSRAMASAATNPARADLFVLAERATLQPSQFTTALQRMLTAPNTELQIAWADVIVRIVRRNAIQRDLTAPAASNASSALHALLDASAAHAALFPNDHSLPQGMPAQIMSAHQMALIFLHHAIARVVVAQPTLLNEVRARFETATPRSRAQWILIPTYLAGHRAQPATLAQALELFAKPPAKADAALLRSIGSLIFQLSREGAQPEAVLHQQLASSESNHRLGALVALEWFPAKFPALRAQVEQLEASDPAAQKIHSNYKHPPQQR